MEEDNNNNNNNENESDNFDSEETGLTVPSVPILPEVSREQVKKFQRQLTALKESILVYNVDYIIETIKGRKVTIFKRTGWEKIGLFFGINTEVVSKEYREFKDVQYDITRHPETGKVTKKEIIKDKAGKPILRTYFAYEFTIKAFCKNRSVEAVGACSSNENKTFTHPMHDIMATAHTRAQSRGICAVIGAGLSFEEISGVDQIKGQQQSQPQRRITSSRKDSPSEKKIIRSQ